MPGVTAAHLLIGRVRRRAAGIADRGRPHARRLPELALGAPETAEPEHRRFETPRVRAGERMAVDIVLIRDRHADRAPRQTLLRRRNFQLLAQRPHRKFSWR